MESRSFYSWHNYCLMSESYYFATRRCTLSAPQVMEQHGAFWSHWSLSSFVIAQLHSSSHLQLAHRKLAHTGSLPSVFSSLCVFAMFLCFCSIDGGVAAWTSARCSYVSSAPMKWTFSYLAPSHFLPLRIHKICRQHEYRNCMLSEKMWCKSLQMPATAIKCSTSPSPLPLATFTHHRYD